MRVCESVRGEYQPRVWADNTRKSLHFSRKAKLCKKIMVRPCDAMDDGIALLPARRSGIEGQLFLMFLRLSFVGSRRLATCT